MASNRHDKKSELLNASDSQLSSVPPFLQQNSQVWSQKSEEGSANISNQQDDLHITSPFTPESPQDHSGQKGEHKVEEHKEETVPEIKHEEAAAHQEEHKVEETHHHEDKHANTNGDHAPVPEAHESHEEQHKAEENHVVQEEHHGNAGTDHNNEIIQDLASVLGNNVTSELKEGNLKEYINHKIRDYESHINALVNQNEELKKEGVPESPEKKPYEVKQSTKEFIQMVQQEWITELIQNENWDEKIYQILVLLFLVQGNSDVPNINDHQKVRAYAVEKLAKEADIGAYLMGLEHHLHLDTERKIRIAEFLKDKTLILNPNSFDGVDALCGVVSFIMKEACEYLGVVPSELAKKPAAKEKVYLLNQDKIEFFHRSQNQLIEIANKHNIQLTDHNNEIIQDLGSVLGNNVTSELKEGNLKEYINHKIRDYESHINALVNQNEELKKEGVPESPEKKPYEVKQSTKEFIQMVEQEWITELIQNENWDEKIYQILVLLFLVQGNSDVPSSNDHQKVRAYAVEKLAKEADIGAYLMGLDHHLQLDTERKIRIAEFLKDKTLILNPNSFDGVDALCSVVSFFMKEACDYLGVVPSELAKKPAAKEKIYLLNQDKIRFFNQSQNQLIEIAHKHNIQLDQFIDYKSHINSLVMKEACEYLGVVSSELAKKPAGKEKIYLLKQEKIEFFNQSQNQLIEIAHKNAGTDHNNEIIQDLASVLGNNVTSELKEGNLKEYINHKIRDYESHINALVNQNEELKKEGVPENPEKKPYEVKQSTKEFIQMVQQEWITELIQNENWDEKIYQILVLLFLVQGNSDVPSINDDQKVRAYAVEKLTKEADIGAYLMGLEHHLHLDTERKIRIAEFLKDKTLILNPNSFDGLDVLCGVVSLIMKEACEYLGVVPSELAKKPAAKEKIYLLNQDKIRFFNQSQNQLIEIAHKHNIQLDQFIDYKSHINSLVMKEACEDLGVVSSELAKKPAAKEKIYLLKQEKIEFFNQSQNQLIEIAHKHNIQLTDHNNEIIQDLASVLGNHVTSEFKEGNLKEYINHKIIDYEKHINALVKQNEELKKEGVPENPEKKPYEVKQSTKEFIQMVQQEWVTELIQNENWDEKIYQILVLLFLVQGNSDVPSINDHQKVRAYAVDKLAKEADIGAYLMGLDHHLHLDTERKIRIAEFLKDKTLILNPNSFDGVDALCGVVSFIMKEACEYLGVVPSELAKKPAAKEKVYLLNQDKIEFFNQSQNQLIEIAHKHNIQLTDHNNEIIQDLGSVLENNVTSELKEGNLKEYINHKIIDYEKHINALVKQNEELKKEGVPENPEKKPYEVKQSTKDFIQMLQQEWITELIQNENWDEKIYQILVLLFLVQGNSDVPSINDHQKVRAYAVEKLTKEADIGAYLMGLEHHLHLDTERKIRIAEFLKDKTLILNPNSFDGLDVLCDVVSLIMKEACEYLGVVPSELAKKPAAKEKIYLLNQEKIEFFNQSQNKLIEIAHKHNIQLDQ